MFCHFLIHSQTTTPCQAREFLSRKAFGRGCPFSPKIKASSLWIKAFHIWNNIRSSRFLVHPEKPLILATIWPKSLASCWVPFCTECVSWWHQQQPVLCPRCQGRQVWCQGRRVWCQGSQMCCQGCCNGHGQPWGHLGSAA